MAQVSKTKIALFVILSTIFTLWIFFPEIIWTMEAIIVLGIWIIIIGGFLMNKKTNQVK